MESNCQDSHSKMWAGLRTITDYKRKTSSAEIMSVSLPLPNNSPAEEAQKAQDPCPLVISTADVCKSFKRTNPRKAPELDGIPGRALKMCADQLVDIFKDIFNLSLLQFVVLFKGDHHCPCPQKGLKPSDLTTTAQQHSPPPS